jgi:hypothetical protein
MLVRSLQLLNHRFVVHDQFFYLNTLVFVVDIALRLSKLLLYDWQHLRP